MEVTGTFLVDRQEWDGVDMGLGWQELLIILVIAVLLFGGSKLAGLGKASGRALREFKEETKGLHAADTAQAGALSESGRARSAGADEVVDAVIEETPERPASGDKSAH